MSYLDETQIYLRSLVRVKFRHSLRTLFAFETSYALEIFHAKGKQKKIERHLGVLSLPNSVLHK